MSCFFRFMKFNTRFLRKILIRDDRPESSIVALYKKLELQNTMAVLDTVSGDISEKQILSEEYDCYFNTNYYCGIILASNVIL